MSNHPEEIYAEQCMLQQRIREAEQQKSQPKSRAQQWTEYEEWQRAILIHNGDCLGVLGRKREDYGTGNINMTGEYGVAVRLLDKVCRLVNLLKEGKEPNNESVEDTLMDIHNYSDILHVMRKVGKW